MAPRIETKLRAALQGYTTETVIAANSSPGQVRSIRARISHSLETLPSVRYFVHDGDTITLATEHLSEAVTAYCAEE